MLLSLRKFRLGEAGVWWEGRRGGLGVDGPLIFREPVFGIGAGFKEALEVVHCVGWVKVRCCVVSGVRWVGGKGIVVWS